MSNAILFLLSGSRLPVQLVLAVFLFALPLEKRAHWKLRTAAALPVFLLGFPYLFSVSLLPFGQKSGAQNYLFVSIYYSFAGYFLSFLFALWLCCITPREALFCATCGYLVQHFAYCFCALLWPGAAEADRFYPNVQVILSFVLFYVAAYFLFSKKLAENGHYDMRPRRALLTTTTALASSLVLSAVAQNIRNEHEQVETYSICLIYAMICCFYMLYTQVILRRQLMLQREVDIRQQLFQKSQSQYDTLQESMELVNRKCHDLKHQLAALRSLPEAQRNDSLRMLENSALVYDAIIETGNKTLNVVLTEKSLLCRARDIQFTCIADGACLDFMEPLDIYAVFGNALDNAIEAVGGLSAAQPRMISLLIMQRAGMALIQVENPYEGVLQLDDGLPKTSKPNELRYHGYGLKNIRATTEKYGGCMAVETQGQMFVLRLAFPHSR